MDKQTITNQTKAAYEATHAQIDTLLIEYTRNKQINDRNREAMRKATTLTARLSSGLPGLTAMTNQLKAAAKIKSLWEEQERLFLLLLEMGAIPEVSYAR